jgi:hypothetical protein
VIDEIVYLISDIMKNKIFNESDTKLTKQTKVKQATKDTKATKATKPTKDNEQNNTLPNLETKDRTRQNYSNFIKLKVCSKTQKKSTRFCNYDETTKKYYLNLNKEQLDYFSYLLANDLINKKQEADTILKGSFIPEFNIDNKIFHDPNEIIISSTTSLLKNIYDGVYSKHRQNIILDHYLINENERIITDDEINNIEKEEIKKFKITMNTIINDVVDLSIKNIFTDEVINTTPFNKNNIYDTSSYISKCKFPYIDKSTNFYILFII